MDIQLVLAVGGLALLGLGAGAHATADFLVRGDHIPTHALGRRLCRAAMLLGAVMVLACSHQW